MFFLLSPTCNRSDLGFRATRQLKFHLRKRKVAIKYGKEPRHPIWVMYRITVLVLTQLLFTLFWSCYLTILRFSWLSSNVVAYKLLNFALSSASDISLKKYIYIIYSRHCMAQRKKTSGWSNTHENGMYTY